MAKGSVRIVVVGSQNKIFTFTPKTCNSILCNSISLICAVLTFPIQECPNITPTHDLIHLC